MKISHYLLLPLMLACSIHADAQKTDSLFKLIAQRKTDTNAVKAYLQLAEIYLNSNPDSAATLSKKAIEIIKQQSYNKLLPKAYNGLGMANYYVGKYQESIKAFDNYYEASKNNDDKISMGFARNNQGNVYIELGKYDSTLQLYKEALKIRKAAKDSFGIAQSYNNLGYVSKEIGDYDKAIEYMLLALREFEKLDNKTAAAVTTNTIGQVYLKKDDFETGISYFKKAVKVFEDLKDDRNLAISYHSLGNAYLKKNLPDSTTFFFHKALKLYEQTKDTRQVALLNANLGEVNDKLSKHELAQKYYRTAIVINREIGNSRGLPNVLNGYAASLIKTGALQQAKVSLDSANMLLTGSIKKTDIRDYHQTMAEYYQATGQLENALKEYSIFTIYKDSILNEANLKSIADMQIKYESEKKEQEITLQKAEVQKKNAWLIGISGLSVLLILLGISYYNRFKLKKEKELQNEVMHQQEMATKAIIEAEENERRRIATELHDGVGQMMSAAKMNLSAFESDMKGLDDHSKVRLEKIVNLVDESCKEVRVVSHSMMPNALLKRGLAAAVQDFLDKIDSKTLKVNLYAEGLDERLEPGVESMLYRIIQECVNNVIKHSGANYLDISLVKDPEAISLTVEDNGKGFDTSRTDIFEGIGLKNIISRVQFLKGTIEFDSTPNRGTLVAIHVPTVDV